VLWGPGPACLLPIFPGAGFGLALSTCLLTVVPLLCVRRLWAFTPGRDTLLDQAFSDARRAPATQRLPEGHQLVRMAFICSGSLLLVLALAGAPFAPVLAAMPVGLVLLSHLPLARARWKARTRLIDVLDGALWPPGVPPPVEVEFAPDTDEAHAVHLVLPPNHSPSQDANASEGLRARLGVEAASLRLVEQRRDVVGLMARGRLDAPCHGKVRASADGGVKAVAERPAATPHYDRPSEFR